MSASPWQTPDLDIDGSVRDRIFEPFFTTKDVGRGSGLGLSQVLGLLKQLGGGIVVRGGPGEGTGFELCLPKARVGQAVPAPPRERAAPAPPGRGVTVLVVDDDPEVRRVAAEMLRAVGHDVRELASGAEALACLQQARPDVVLADVAMPMMNGVELAEAARRRWPGLPVLFMTGYVEPTVLAPAGGEDVIHKPFEAGELAVRVARAAARAAGVSGNPASAP